MRTLSRGFSILTASLGLSLLLANVCDAQSAKAKSTPAPAAGKAAPAAGKTAKPAPAAPLDPAKMKALLQNWEKESAKLKTLDVGITRTDKSPLWEAEIYKGRAIFQNPNLAWINFEKVQKNEKGESQNVPYERIVCSGTDFWQYRFDTKEIFIFPIERKEQKKALEEGPLPFLFNMKAAEVEARYQMDLLKETPEFFIISVIPKLKYDLQTFAKAFLQLSRTTYLPEKIFMVSPDGKSTKEFSLSAIQRNKAVDKKLFVGKELPKPWSTRRDVLKDAEVEAKVPIVAPKRR